MLDLRTLLVMDGAVLVTLLFIAACTAATLWLATRQERHPLPRFRLRPGSPRSPHERPRLGGRATQSLPRR